MIPAIERALQRLAYRQISGDANSYHRGYASLTRLFTFLNLTEGRTPERLERAIGGAYAVYGWMPTMLHSLPDSDELLSLVEFVSAWSAGTGPNPRENLGVFATFRNSPVGTSKFLHFAAPNVFPIWDTWVARALGFRYRYQYAKPEIYCDYLDSMHAYIAQGGQLPRNYMDWLGNGDAGTAIGTIRRLELALFLEGKLAANSI